MSAESRPDQALGRRFAPGQSGNPGGRPAVVREFRKLCVDYMQTQGWARLQQIANGRNTATALKALEVIASYAYGRPTATVDVVVWQAAERLAAAIDGVTAAELLDDAEAMLRDQAEW